MIPFLFKRKPDLFRNAAEVLGGCVRRSILKTLFPAAYHTVRSRTRCREAAESAKTEAVRAARCSRTACALWPTAFSAASRDHRPAGRTPYERACEQTPRQREELQTQRSAISGRKEAAHPVTSKRTGKRYPAELKTEDGPGAGDGSRRARRFRARLKIYPKCPQILAPILVQRRKIW